MLSKIKSVHLQDFPSVANINDEKELTEDMDMIRDICSTALAVRDRNNLRVRLPLNKLTVIGKGTERLKQYQKIIADEINVKSIDFKSEIGDLAKLKLQLDFKKVGAKLGGKMKDILVALKKGEWKRLPNNELDIDGVKLVAGEYLMKLEAKDPKSTGVLANSNVLVQLDVNITDDLKLEGLARDIVRLIQQNRKNANLNISDKIHLFISTDDDFLKKAINKHSEYIQAQTLSKSIEIGDKKGKHNFNHKIGEKNLGISFDVVK